MKGVSQVVFHVEASDSLHQIPIGAEFVHHSVGLYKFRGIFGAFRVNFFFVFRSFLHDMHINEVSTTAA